MQMFRMRFFTFASHFAQSFLQVILMCAVFILMAFSGNRANAADIIASEGLLRANLSVAGDTITLGDLFEGAGDAANVRVASAPAPGARISLRPDYIQRLAYQNGVAWSNPNQLKRVTVTRDSQTFTTAQLGEAVETALPNELMGADYDIVLAQSSLKLHAPINVAADLNVSDLRFDASSGRFTATATSWEGGAPVAISGRATPVIRVPVLVAPVARGELIPAEIVTYTRTQAQRAPYGVARSVEDVAGMAARRNLPAGAPIRMTDIERPKVIRKGELVTIRFKTKGIRLTMMGRALADAALNEVVGVLNINSHRTVQAVATGPNEAAAATPMNLAALN